MYYNIKKQNGNECTELEGGLNATHRHSEQHLANGGDGTVCLKRRNKMKLPEIFATKSKEIKLRRLKWELKWKFVDSHAFSFLFLPPNGKIRI